MLRPLVMGSQTAVTQSSSSRPELLSLMLKNSPGLITVEFFHNDLNNTKLVSTVQNLLHVAGFLACVHHRMCLSSGLVGSGAGEERIPRFKDS
jgi:hypothetical protein